MRRTAKRPEVQKVLIDALAASDARIAARRRARGRRIKAVPDMPRSAYPPGMGGPFSRRAIAAMEKDFALILNLRLRKTKRDLYGR